MSETRVERFLLPAATSTIVGPLRSPAATRAVATLFGTSTLSMTWMTPFEAFTSAVVTKAFVRPDESDTASLLPSRLSPTRPFVSSPSSVATLVFALAESIAAPERTSPASTWYFNTCWSRSLFAGSVSAFVTPGTAASSFANAAFVGAKTVSLADGSASASASPAALTSDTSVEKSGLPAATSTIVPPVFSRAAPVPATAATPISATASTRRSFFHRSFPPLRVVCRHTAHERKADETKKDF